MKGALALLVLVPACGRVGFGEQARVDDGSLGDAAGATDGAVGDAAAQSFCASLAVQPTLCFDYDEGGQPTDGWTDAFATNGGMLALSTAHAYSQPGSLAASYADVDTGGTPLSAGLELARASGVSASVDFWFYMEARPPNDQQTELGGVGVIDSAGNRFDFDLMMNANSVAVDAYHEEEIPAGGGYLHTEAMTAAPLATGVWHHVQIAVDAGAATEMATVDDVVLVNGPTVNPVVPGQTIVSTGIGYVPGGTLQGWQVWIDDYTADVE